MSPFAIDAKGGERFRWEHALRGEHELLSSMKKRGRLLLEIVSDANTSLIFVLDANNNYEEPS